MSLRTSISVVQGASDVAGTGGAATTFVNDGQGRNGKNVLIEADNGNLMTRKKMITSVDLPVPARNSNALAKLGHSDFIMHHPKVDSNGKLYRRAAEIKIGYHPEDSEAERAQIFWDTIHAAIDAELTGFFTKAVND